MNKDRNPKKQESEPSTAALAVNAQDSTVPFTTRAVSLGSSNPVLTESERETAEELERLDPNLAGLYRMGLGLCSRIDEPGVVFLVGFVGRELGLGLVRMLIDPDAAPLEDEGEEVPENESYSEQIASMLGVQPTHASVRIWHRTHRTLHSAAHFRIPRPAPVQIREAFLQLSGLLFGRIAPYFSTHAELNSLIRVADPTPAQIARVRQLLVRPVQRHHFFRSLEHPGWLAPLAEAGFFLAPHLSVTREGLLRTQPWPEGEFLVRVANAAPDSVTRLLVDVPRTNRNPVVWSVIARAAIELPASNAGDLAQPLVRAVQEAAAPEFFAHHLIDVTQHLAQHAEPRAFDLAQCLLWTTSRRAPARVVRNDLGTNDQTNPEQGEEASKSVSDALGSWYGRRNTDWMLARVDEYGLSQFLRKSLPPLEALDPERLLEMLAGTLNRAVRLGRLAAMDGQAQQGVPAADEPETRDASERWVAHLDQPGEGGDIRAQLAAAVTAIASRLALRGPAGAENVNRVLKQFSSDVFARIRLMALAAAGELVSTPVLDSVMSELAIVDPPFGAREVASFLRAQFNRTSSATQMEFLAALERGPMPEGVERTASLRRPRNSNMEKGSDEEGEEKGANSEAVVQEAEERLIHNEWQRRRLCWFQDRIPPILEPLATALGVQPQMPSAHDQALAEVGWWSEGVVSREYRSPITPTALAGMTPREVIEFLRTWRADAALSRFERPSSEGLASTLTVFVSEYPSKAHELVEHLLDSSVEVRYLAAVVAGEKALIAAQQPVPWSAIAGLTRMVFSEIKGDPHSQEIRTASAAGDEHVESRVAIQHAIDLIREACARDLIPEEAYDDLWNLSAEVIGSPSLWTESRRSNASVLENREESLGDVEFAAINSLPGHAVRMLVEVALWDSRRKTRVARPTKTPDAKTDAVARVVPLLDSVLEHTNDPGRLARASLGMFVPHLLLLAHGWTVKHLESLFAGGAASPATNPAWGTYLAHGGFYDDAFRELRPWYLIAADAAPDPSPGSEKSHSSISRSLAEHIIVALVRGVAKIGETDRLVERVFERVRPEDRQHAYWSIFRGWSDAKGRIPEDFARRLVEFWEWRVVLLEHEPESGERADEADRLLWLLRTPSIAAVDAIRLGLRTLQLGDDKAGRGPALWDRLAELATVDAVGAFELVALVISRGLATETPFLRYPQVAPALRVALTSSDVDVRRRARRLIHMMGDRGLFEFGELLGEIDA